MAKESYFNIDVIFADIGRQSCYTVSVKPGDSVKDAILQCGILCDYPDIDLNVNKVGIFSRIVALSTQLVPGDRVEVYRPLTMSPKQARRLRASRKR